MLSNLREAIGFKADWKAYAKTDLEFASSSMMILLNQLYNNLKTYNILKGTRKGPFFYFIIRPPPLKGRGAKKQGRIV